MKKYEEKMKFPKNTVVIGSLLGEYSKRAIRESPLLPRGSFKLALSF